MITLHDYQKEGVEWLTRHTHGILADEMGLGKSAQLIVAADKLNAQKIIIVCRAVARRNWENEFNKFSVKSRPIFIIENQHSAIPKETDESFVVICSFEGIDSVVSRLPASLLFDVAGVDESHFAKDPKTKRTKAIFGTGGLVRRARRFWCLTGTPTPNHFGELWLPLFVFGATKLKYDQWITKFCTVADLGYGKQVTGSRTDPVTIAYLKLILNKCLLRREVCELDLPEISFQDVIVEPGKVDIKDHKNFDGMTAGEIADRVEKEYGILYSVLNQTKMSDDLLSILSATASSITTLRRFNGLQKIDAVCDLLTEELDSDKTKKLVVFAIHRAVIEELCNRLERFGVVRIWGGSDQKKVSEEMIEFQTTKKKRLVIGQIQAAGTSITLTAAHDVVLVEKAWTPADNAQAVARVRRIGQTRPVRVRNILLVDDPIEWRISELLDKKSEAILKLFRNDENV